MIAMLGGFIKLSFILVIAVLIIFTLAEKLNLLIIKIKRDLWEKKKANMIRECKSKLAVNPDDEETQDLLKRLELNDMIACLYDYIFYLEDKYNGWQVCPSCKFPAPKGMLACPNCEFVTAKGRAEAKRVRDWAESED